MSNMLNTEAHFRKACTTSYCSTTTSVSEFSPWLPTHEAESPQFFPFTITKPAAASTTTAAAAAILNAANSNAIFSATSGPDVIQASVKPAYAASTTFNDAIKTAEYSPAVNYISDTTTSTINDQETTAVATIICAPTSRWASATANTNFITSYNAIAAAAAAAAIGPTSNMTNMQQNQLLGPQNSIADMQQHHIVRQRLSGQQNNLQQHQQQQQQ
ncbi:hypothetical protein QJS04_geneDACA020285 [Acorus gramineus]|uniref:Uncharacterized protein n=1 Tax=Acorus gramineus TaxID=55184 RepID=A0AAV9AD32_ACOGR|nr:hypothetical protein QJS04_geneDACA020285 [Acorus gramineus]